MQQLKHFMVAEQCVFCPNFKAFNAAGGRNANFKAFNAAGAFNATA